MGTLLSKASHSDELVARINHTNLILHPSWINLLAYCGLRTPHKELQTFIQGVGDYLMRVVGSVPIGFHLTAEIRMEEEVKKQYYYDTDIVQF
jgi:hypothetical protein